MMTTQPAPEEISHHKLWRMSQLMKEKIFFIKCESFVRVCRSSYASKWVLSGMQTHCPFEMVVIKEIPGGIKLQQEIENTFSGYRHNGLWFRYEGELKRWLDSSND